MVAAAVVDIDSWVFGSIEGLTAAVMLVFGAHYPRKAALLGTLSNTLGHFGALFALLVVLGVVDTYPSALVGLAETAARALAGVVP